MTVSTHTYYATLLSDDLGAVSLNIEGGSITLDAGAAPHAQADVEISLPDAETLESLDPRNSPRVLITALATFPSGPQSRTFDLGVRDREVQHADGEVTLSLASDEALLEDYAPLSDIDMYEYAGDLATLCEQVVLTATGDAVTVGGETADVTPYWSVTFGPGNSGFDGGTTAGYVAGNNISPASLIVTSAPDFYASTPYALRYQVTAAGAARLDIGLHNKAFTVTPGKTYTVGIQTRTITAPTGGILGIRWVNADGDTIGSDTQDFTVSATEMNPVKITAQAPAGASFIWPYEITTGNAAGQLHYVDNVQIVEGEFLPEYFDGNTPDTDIYDYAWAGNTNSSQKIRTLLVDAPEREAVMWRAGQSAIDFLAPLVQAAGLRLVCDEQRAWTLRNESFRAPGSIAIRHGVNLIDGTDRIDREAGFWFDAAVAIYKWTDRDGIEQRRMDTYALNTPPSRVKTFEFDSAYPGTGFAEYAVRRAQGRGREVTATAVANWRARAEQMTTIVLEGAPVQTGTTQTVRFDLDRDEMTVQARTTDTPPLAWTLGPGDLTWNDVTPSLTWDAMTEWSDA